MRREIVLVVSLVLVGAGGAAWAEPRSPGRRGVSVERQVDELSTESASALMRGDYDAVLKLTERGLALAPDSSWLLYHRAQALADLGRLDEALPAFDKAERSFLSDRWGLSTVLYGRADMLYNAARCEEASQAFTRYANFVRNFDVDAARIAMTRAGNCRTPTQVTAAPSPSPERQPVRGTESPQRPIVSGRRSPQPRR